MKSLNLTGIQNILDVVRTFRKSQHFQDLFVLSELDYKRDGFFVEFGATNGESISNTWILEKIFGWKGILAEPALVWHQDLYKNRNCIIDTRCVWTESNSILKFNQTQSPELSKIDIISNDDWAMELREVNSLKYEVKTISLNDLLKEHNAPQEIDYISVDTEGSEFQILQAFDFEYFKVKIWTVENNLKNDDWNVSRLMYSKGYKRVYRELSSYDDWYVLDEDQKK
jgi:FkbM family methyltransferase